MAKRWLLSILTGGTSFFWGSFGGFGAHRKAPLWQAFTSHLLIEDLHGQNNSAEVKSTAAFSGKEGWPWVTRCGALKANTKGLHFSRSLVCKVPQISKQFQNKWGERHLQHPWPVSKQSAYLCSPTCPLVTLISISSHLCLCTWKSIIEANKEARAFTIQTCLKIWYLQNLEPSSTACYCFFIPKAFFMGSLKPPHIAFSPSVLFFNIYCQNKRTNKTQLLLKHLANEAHFILKALF